MPLSATVASGQVGNKLFLDKRGDSTIDYVTCNETAHDVGEEEKDSINHPAKLMAEATFINQNFTQQALFYCCTRSGSSHTRSLH